jgi:hypothetical protein
MALVKANYEFTYVDVGKMEEYLKMDFWNILHFINS